MRIDAGPARGTGFFVGPGLLLTCAHVVASSDAPVVRWRGQPHPVTTTQLFPPGGRSGTGRYPDPDLALLTIALAQNPALPVADEPLRPGASLYAYGHTDEYPDGDSALFTYEGPSEQERLLRLKDAQARPGLSGAPLLEAGTGSVVGVVKRSRDRSSDLGSRAVPAAVVLATVPALRVRPGGPAAEPDSRERDHLRRLLEIHQRQLEVLERQAAEFGAFAPPYVITTMDRERAAIADLRHQLGH